MAIDWNSTGIASWLRKHRNGRGPQMSTRVIRLPLTGRLQAAKSWPAPGSGMLQQSVLDGPSRSFNSFQQKKGSGEEQAARVVLDSHMLPMKLLATSTPEYAELWLDLSCTSATLGTA